MPHGSNRNCQLGLRLPEGLRRDLEEIARRRGTTLSVVARRALEAFVDAERQVPIAPHLAPPPEVRLYGEWMLRLPDDARRFLFGLGELLASQDRPDEKTLRWISFLRQGEIATWCIEFSEPIPVNLPTDEQISRMYRTGVVADCNRVMARLYGYHDPAELKGQRIGTHFVKYDPKNIEMLRRFIRAGYRAVAGISRETDLEGRQRILMNNAVGEVRDGKLYRIWGMHQELNEDDLARVAGSRND